MSTAKTEAENAAQRFIKNSDTEPTPQQLAKHMRKIAAHAETIAQAADTLARRRNKQIDLLDTVIGDTK